MSLHLLTRTSELRVTDILHLQRDPDTGGRQDLGLSGAAILGPLAVRASRSSISLNGGKAYAALGTAGAVEAADFTLGVGFLVESITDTSRQIQLSETNSSAVTGSNLLRLLRSGNDLAIILDGATSADRITRTWAGFFTTYSGPGFLIMARDVAGLSLTTYWRGALFPGTSADVVTGSKSWGGTVADAYLCIGSSGGGSAGVIYDAFLINRKWTQADVDTFTLTGDVPPQDRGPGSMVSRIDLFPANVLTVGAGDSNTLIPASNDGFGASVSAVAGARTGGAGAWFARWTRTTAGAGANAAHLIGASSVDAAKIQAGSVVVVSGYVRRSVGMLASALSFGLRGGAEVLVSGILGDGSWLAFNITLVAGSSSAGLVARVLGNNWPQNDYFDFDDVVVTPIGTVARWDLGPDFRGIGRHNGIDLVIASGARPLPVDTTRGTIRFRRTSTGFANDGNRLIGDGRILTELMLYSPLGGTVTIGDASGTPANVVASVSLTAGVWTRVSLLKSILAGGLVYVALGTAAEVQGIGETRDGTILV